MKNTLILAGMLVASLFLVTGAFANTKNPLELTKWNLISFDGNAASGASLDFKGSEISAKFCNILWGSYSLSGNRIHTWPFMATLMFCEGMMMTYEDNFNLSGAKYELLASDTVLSITQENGHRYERERVGIKKHFEKSLRNLVSFDGQTSKEASLEFNGNQLSATFCNHFSGRYFLEGNFIVNEGLISTRMACEGELGTYESAFNLSGAEYDTPAEHQLLITTQKGHRYLWERLPKPTWMPNPASVHCEKKWGKLVIKNNPDGGQYGVCTFSDASQCEEWAYYRWECTPQQEKIHKVLDNHFQKTSKQFPTKKEKSDLITHIKGVLIKSSRTVGKELQSVYQKVITALEHYIVK